ncbi:uncharacterized protein EV420DRAFT_1517370 [Desarmillaria tabescens]|uniref:Uncharacterized protein n=1 Tax=Armillaria tabescens TaxID=1929756 RepID=A0AA39NFG2_ARMTA|nr:uncharacterized protein EV420DRAFT_1517370 [Desarmillaria tabescens]KAK0464645.1 hypothetical protein EV420DRAFT_1517370 [Desarmillaria tabescens]
MALPVELIARILTEAWINLPASTEEHIKTFMNLSLVSKQWAAIMKEVNSMHSLIPFSYNGGQLYTIKSLSSISNPMLCHTLTFRVNYTVTPQRLVVTGCEPSIVVNQGIESFLRKLFCGSNTPRHGIHIFVDYFDDSRVHVPSFWIPPQITRLTIVYRYRSWISDWIEARRFRLCDCERSTVDHDQVEHLTILGATSELTRGLITPLNKWKCLSSLTIDSSVRDIGIPVSSRISVIRRSDGLRYETVEPNYACRVMFGDQYHRAYWFYRSSIDIFDKRDIPMLEQVIPLGSVGYIDPLTRKFIVLFNAMDPGSLTDARLDSIPSLLESGVTKLIVNPNHSSGRVWDHKHPYLDVASLFGALNEGKSVYHIPVGLDRPEELYLTLGRACRKDLIGTHFETWLIHHKQKILDIFGDEHPYIRKRIDLVTTTIDSSQYAWFAHLGFKSQRRRYMRIQTFYFRRFKVPKYNHIDDLHDLISWSHVSILVPHWVLLFWWRKCLASKGHGDPRTIEHPVI